MTESISYLNWIVIWFLVGIGLKILDLIVSVIKDLVSKA
jgi:hypothetical protein